eukprot:scaffold266133_cov31-Tisochrysis_lutea.AAC.1
MRLSPRCLKLHIKGEVSVVTGTARFSLEFMGSGKSIDVRQVSTRRLRRALPPPECGRGHAVCDACLRGPAWAHSSGGGLPSAGSAAPEPAASPVHVVEI